MAHAPRDSRIARWTILASVAAAAGPASCFLDAEGLGSGGSGGAPTTGSTASGTSAGTSSSGTGASTSSSGTGASTSSATSSSGTGGGLCGNGLVDPGEDCDGTALGGKTCASLGHTGGALACDGLCKFDQTACFDYPTNWYDIAWHHRRTITIHASQVAANLTNFPVVLSINDATILGKLQSGAQDVLITLGDGKTKLSHEIELFDAATSTLVVWVRAPALSSTTDTSLYLYYGNATCASQEDAVNVWDASDQGVWHLGEKATAGATTAVHHDATGHGYEGSQKGNSDTAGKLGRGQSFDGVSNYIDIANPTGVVIGTADCTISAWIKTAAAADFLSIVSKSQAAPMAWTLGTKVFALGLGHLLGFESYAVATVTSPAPLNNGNWRHVVWTQASGTPATWALYVDGVPKGSQTCSPQPDASTFGLRFGSAVPGSNIGGSFFNGTIDELRISSTPRSAAWILTSFRSQGTPASFYALGAEEGGLVP
jgi:MSHA biogenesis protein MshQ